MDNMFCYQCEQTAGCSGCTGSRGVCGKTADVSNLQDVLTGSWWIIVIPGVFLVATLLSLTEIGNTVRKRANRSRRIL